VRQRLDDGAAVVAALVLAEVTRVEAGGVQLVVVLRRGDVRGGLGIAMEVAALVLPPQLTWMV